MGERGENYEARDEYSSKATQITRSHKRMSQNLKRCSGLSVRPVSPSVSKSHFSTIWAQQCALGIKRPKAAQIPWYFKTVKYDQVSKEESERAS